MTDAAWRVEARRLLATVLSIEAVAREHGPAAWVAREAGRIREPGVGVRWASSPSELGLGPFAGLDDRASWVVTPSADEREDLVRVVVDADRRLLRADGSRWDEPRQPVAVGGADADGTQRLVVVDHDELVVVVRSPEVDGRTVTVRATWDDGDLFVLDVLVERRTGDGILRLRGRVHPTMGGATASRSRRTDRLRLDATRGPVAWYDDAPAGADPDGTADGEAEPLEDLESGGPEALLESAAALVDPDADPPTDRLRWAADLHGVPPPLVPLTFDLVQAGAQAMLGTILRAAAASGVSSPCAIVLDHGVQDDPSVLPELLLVERTFRDRWRDLPGDRSGAFRLRESVESGEGTRVSLVDHADAETLEHWLPLRRAEALLPGVSEEDREAAVRQLWSMRGWLMLVLLGHDFGPPWAGPVLPWLDLGEDITKPGGGELRPWEELREHADPADFAALQRAWPARGTTPEEPDESDDLVPGRGGDDSDGGDAPDALVTEARRSRAGLRRLFEREGLGAHAGPLADAARPGFALDVASSDAQPVVSRVAGPALLPPGVEWPTTTDGEPLTFVAALDLAELPATQDPHPLPADGVLLVYVLVGDPDPDEGMLDFVEAEDEGAIVLHVPAGTAAVVVDAPPVGVLRVAAPYDRPLPLERRAPSAAVPVVLRAILQPVSDYDVGARFGLHPTEFERYEHVVWSLLPEDEEPAGSVSDPWEDDRFDDEKDDEVQWAADADRPARRVTSGTEDPDDASAPEGPDSTSGPEQDLRDGDVRFGNLDAFIDLDDGTDDGAHHDGRDEADCDLDDPFDAGLDDGPAVSGTVLGTEPGVQGYPLDDDELVLLALAGTPELGLEWGDGGDLRVLIRADDLAAGRWDRAWATGDCS